MNVTVDDRVVYSKGFDILTRGFSPAEYGESIPNENWVERVRDKLYAIYDRIKDWL